MERNLGDFSIEALPAFWSAALVGKRLVQAFVTLDRTAGLRCPRALGGNWPRAVIEWADQLAQAELEESERLTRSEAANRTVIHPSAAEITQMEKAFEWLRELRAADSGMALVTTLWALRAAQGRSIKRLCAEKRWAPYTFFRKRAKALVFVAAMLNARGVPVF
ncbi:MAG: hypothetical protein ACREC9_15700 [Methylocella sp.]